MSRSSIRPALSWSCQEMIALKVSGLSHSPPIIMSRPASMRLAMAISPSRDSSSTLPISRRYMRTGSSVRPRLASSTLPVGSSSSASSAFSTLTGGGLAVLGFLALDDLDAHFVEIGHHVFDLLGAVLLRRQNGVQLVEGDVAALLAAGDQPLDGDGLHIEQGGFHILLRGDGFGGYGGLRRHR